jgi:alpha-galactosidase
MLEAILSNRYFSLEFTGDRYFFEYSIYDSGRTIHFSYPLFEIEGKTEQIRIDLWQKPVYLEKLNNGVIEYLLKGISSSTRLSMNFFVRISDDSPIVRFRYELHSEDSYRLTKNKSEDNITYLGVNLNGFKNFKEVRLSEFNEMLHSSHLTESEIDLSWFENSQSLMGPIFISGEKNNSFLIAYEHGSQYPERFLEFQLNPNHSLALKAVKANYLHNLQIEGEQIFETVWFEFGGVAGGEELLASEYRNFILKYISNNAESRKPYIFYNTWGRQEKIKWAGERYLTTMNLEYTLKEIDRAHEMGIEVYVIDTGWYLKTGDWEVNLALFPDKLKEIKSKLDGYGMKLGLWFNPTAAALTSEIVKRNNSSRVTKGGLPDEPCEIWETEKSVGLCFVSPYWNDFANRLIELVNETGVTYFKWDAIWQYGCDAPGHFHGDGNCTEQERKDRYAYLLPIYMAKVIEKVSKACPEAIFDFDITEEGRCVGLQFLAHGKYFAINNGPYYHNFDVSEEWESPTADGNPNIFVNPGAARGWFTRSVLDYDKWIPSVLFLTHYFPYGPASSQMQNLASLMLGQNGIWGEINSLSHESVELISQQLNYYKQVRDDVTASTLVQVGKPGDSCEVYEKINPVNGRGILVMFANTKGEYTYHTAAKVDRKMVLPEGVQCILDSDGRAFIKIERNKKEAVVVFFGADAG